MQKLNLPSYKHRIEIQDDKQMIFDIIRRKLLVLTPEEWVRQHFIHMLIDHYGYPRPLFKVETGHDYNKLQKRTDIIVYGRDGKPFLLVECKAPEVKVSQGSFEQAARYNLTIKAEFLVVTNGLNTFCCKIDHEKGKYEFVKDVPKFL